MKLPELHNKEIVNVFYQDDLGGQGIVDVDKNIHLIEEGNLILELADKTIIEIFIDNEIDGITISEIEKSFLEELKTNKIINDKIWSTISSLKIKAVNDFKSTLEISTDNNPKIQLLEIISTIELVFEYGDTIFITNAGYIEEDIIGSMTNDFIIYRKRQIGQKLNILIKA